MGTQDGGFANKLLTVITSLIAIDAAR